MLVGVKFLSIAVLEVAFVSIQMWGDLSYPHSSTNLSTKLLKYGPVLFLDL